MAFKATVSKAEFEKLPEPVRAEYKEQDGQFVLQVDGMTLDSEVEQINARLAEFRDNNVKLLKDAKRFEGVDIDALKAAQNELSTLKKAGVSKPDDLQAAIAQALAPVQSRLEAMEQAKRAAETALENKNFEDRLWSVGAKAGVDELYREDYINRAKKVFKFKEGDLVAERNEAPIYSKKKNNTTAPLTPEEWTMEWLPTEAPGFFKSSKGTDTKPGGSNAGGGRVLQADPLVIGSNLESIAKGESSVMGAR